MNHDSFILIPHKARLARTFCNAAIYKGEASPPVTSDPRHQQRVPEITLCCQTVTELYYPSACILLSTRWNETL